MTVSGAVGIRDDTRRFSPTRAISAEGCGGLLRKKLSRELNAIWWTLRDLRRTARSLMSRAGVPADHAERCLGHVMPGAHEYLEEKRDAFNKLAASIKGIVNPSKAAAWPGKFGMCA
jgi:hypothetical protein